MPRDDAYDPTCHLSVGDIAVDSQLDLNYLVIQGSQAGPLFMFADGRFLTRQRIVDAIQAALQKSGLNPSRYCGHSFRKQKGEWRTR